VKSFKRKINCYTPSVDSWGIVNQCISDAPLLIIANDAFILNRIYSELRFFRPKLRISIFQDTELLPYERINAQKDIIANRLKVLWQIMHNQVDIVLVQLSTLQTKLCPQEYLYQKLFLLKIGDKLSITELKQKLIVSDYNLVERVFEAGEFAIRGGIIDIMPMGSKQLIRIELFDDEIEELKLIDYKTNQLIEKINEFELIPAREYPTDTQSVATFFQNFNQYFNSVQSKNINALLPAGAEFYLPLFFNSTISLFDYLNTDWTIIYFANALHNLNVNWQEINQRYQLFNYQYPCLKPVDLFLPATTIFTQLKQFNSYEIINQDELNIAQNQLPLLLVNNRIQDPFASLREFCQKFNGHIILVIDSLGRRQIISQALTKYNFKVILINSLTEALSNGQIHLIQGKLYNGFITDNLAFITENELYQYSNSKNYTKSIAIESEPKIEYANDFIVRDLSEIARGDLVVHINYGIGKYLGLTIQKIGQVEYEMLELEYQNESKLFIPVTKLNLISKYSNIDNIEVTLHKLGGGAWDKIKAKALKKINDMAAELLDLYAKREMQQKQKFVLPQEYDDFALRFIHQLTPDQNTAIENIINDMTSSKPMDRLICGDVGFGKTEVALRAAFICAMNNKQVVILAPTTLLTEQHYQNFISRFSGFPINIAEVSRFKTKKEIAQTIELVKNGQIDIIIGTHRLIQNDINFANLGLVIIDEEHRFGVKQKEKLKQLRANVDFLVMTATPIPRTLSLAMEGIRDFSIIATPPKKRLPINTIVANDDNSILVEAVLREVRRGGQVYFLYNDVANINAIYTRLETLFPDLNIVVAHGQMNEHKLEQAIKDFINQKYHILLCSTIVENGIDISNANTMIIYGAHKFGLAQLYQLRGRVGRSHHQAYCYLVIPEQLSNDAQKRIEALKSTTELGSGFNLAIHDLEIRGAGEILGENQSGNIKEVGISLYTEMLKKAINKLRNHNYLSDPVGCEVLIDETIIIPDDYCPNIQERLIFYKRLSKAENNNEIDTVYQEIIDTYGMPPLELTNLIQTHYLRVTCTAMGINKLEINSNHIILNFIPNPPIKTTKIIDLLQNNYNCKYNGSNKITYLIKATNVSDKFKNTEYILSLLA
jgi:transcription-repair coupling factor (superfamily II helicase)